MFIYALLDFLLDFFFDIHDLDFIDQLKAKLLIPFPEVRLIQYFLLIRIVKWNICRDLIHQLFDPFDIKELGYGFLGHLPVLCGIFDQHILESPFHCFTI